MWSAEERGKAVAVYSLAPLMGLVVGPIAEKSTWGWMFWSTTIVDGDSGGWNVFLLREYVRCIFSLVILDVCLLTSVSIL